MKTQSIIRFLASLGVSSLLALAALTTELTTNPVNAKDLSTTIIEKVNALQNSDQRWIEINLSTQRLIAWQGGSPVYAIIVSTGKPATPTRPGIFTIQRKLPKDRMRGTGYDIPNVPHAMYYYGGYAIHGAYWHHNFGTPISHGCTNVAPDHAKWLYNWASVGTTIIIHH